MIACKIAHNIPFVNSLFLREAVPIAGGFIGSLSQIASTSSRFVSQGRHQASGCCNVHTHGFFLFR